MKRLLSTRYGFFGFAALVCWAMLTVIEREHRWVAIVLGALYAVLSLLFFLDESTSGRDRNTGGSHRPDESSPVASPPPPPGVEGP